MEENLNHYKARRFEPDGSSLDQESEHVEVEFSVRGQRDTYGDHEDDDGEFSIRLCESEGPRDEEDSYWVESLRRNVVSERNKLYASTRTLSIWIYETLKWI